MTHEAIEMSLNLCGCSEAELNSRTVEENLKICKDCGFLNGCSYPRSVAMGMVKSDASTPTDKLNLKKLASESMDFKQFHDNSHPQNRLHQPIARPTDSNSYYTKTQKPSKNKNLKEIARTALNMDDYLNKVHDGE
jgi:hypothetical protein